MDREDLLAAMYNDDEPINPPALRQTDLRSRKIRVGVVEYEVPTVEYVRQLEQLLIQQSNLLDQQRRTVDRLTAMLYGTRSFVRRQTGSLSNLNHELHRRGDR